MASTCKDFKPHQLRPERCRNCFQDKSKHSQLAQQQNQPNQSSTSSNECFNYSISDPNRNSHNPKNYRDSRYSPRRILPRESAPLASLTNDEWIEISTSKPDNSNGSKDGAQASDKSSPRVKYVPQVMKSQENSDDTSQANSASFDQHTKADLRNQVQILKKHLDDCVMERNKKDKENQELQNELKRQQQAIVMTQVSHNKEEDRDATQNTAHEILRLKKRNRELEHINEDYRDEIKCLKLEMKELNEECQSKVQKLSSESTNPSGETTGPQSMNCLKDENEKLKEEIKMLEQELDEIQDTFKEEESEQFESLKQDLDLASKNCRILQFKLKKSDRQYAQLEQIKISLERQLKDMCQQRPEETSLFTKENVHYINKRSMDGPTITLPSAEYDQLIRDLHDTMEHEKDLQEQIKYCQEESRVNSAKVSALESENEILMKKVSKLVETKSYAMALIGRQKSNEKSNNSNEFDTDTTSCNVSELLQQIEQLKLGLELGQNENSTLKSQCNQLKRQLEQSETKIITLEKKLDELTHLNEVSAPSSSNEPSTHRLHLLQVECRQLRTKLLESERENRQLRTRVELSQSQSDQPGDSSNLNPGDQLMLNRTAVFNRSRSLEQQQSQQQSSTASLESQISKYRAELSMIKTQNEMLMRQNIDLQDILRVYVRDNQTQNNADSDSSKRPESQLESDLIVQLKNRLHSGEEELAMTKSRLVELELENTRIQREYKKLKQSLEYKRPPSRLNQLRETSTRQELRDIIKLLEDDLIQAQSTVKGRETMLDSCQGELSQLAATCDKLKLERDTIARDLNDSIVALQRLRRHNGNDDDCANEDTKRKHADAIKDEGLIQEQNDTFKLQLEQERLCVSNLKNDIRKLEATRNELATQNHMLERERVSIEEEVDKLRIVNKQLLERTDELRSLHRSTNNHVNELTLSNEHLKSEIGMLQNKLEGQMNKSDQRETSGTNVMTKYQIVERDCDELKVKNLFLLKKLDGMESDYKNKADELRTQFEAQKKHEIELAKLETKEKLQVEVQHLKDELSEARQKLTNVTRQQNQTDHEYRKLDEKYKLLDKESKREKARLASKIDQLEQDLDSDRRKQDRLEREKDSLLKDKDRQLLNVQDTCVQLERELKRAQAKLSTSESDFELRISNLVRELAKEKNDKDQLTQKCRKAEEDYYYQKMRSDSEKATLVEAIDSARRSYDEKLAEIKSIRDLMTVRQDQHFKEKLLMQEKVQAMEVAAGKLSTLEYDYKQMKSRCETQETNLDQLRRDERLLREEKTRLRAKCEELERKCSNYEKRELASKTSSISPTGLGQSRTVGANPKQTDQQFCRFDYETRIEQLCNELESTKSQLSKIVEEKRKSDTRSNSNSNNSEFSLSERLTGKINDQRHHIKTLKTQMDDFIAELKNAKLLHRAEKSSWQVQMVEMNSKLNEREEKLLLETSSRLATRNLAKTKMEIAWQKERQNAQDLLRKQQSQIDTLTDDLRQALQSLQSAKMTSQQENKRHERMLASLSQANKNDDDGASETFAHLRHQIDICEDERSRLQQKVAHMDLYNEKVISAILKELSPLLPIITKILNTLDKVDTSKDDDTNNLGSDHQPSNVQSSTNRPLTTTSRNINPPDDGDDEASLASGTNSSVVQTNTSNRTASGSRLSRFLSKKASGENTSSNTLTPNSQRSNTSSPPVDDTKSKPKVTKKVKIKSSSIGISTGEKKQMKICLKKLEKLIGEIKSTPSTHLKDHNQQLDYSKTKAKRTLSIEHKSDAVTQRHDFSPPVRSVSYSPSRANFKDNNRELTKNWHSDMESESTSSSPAQNYTDMDDTLRTSDYYRRFPTATSYGRQQRLLTNFATPIRRSGADSTTDYDSESSVASDLNSRGGKISGGSYLISGTESDSGVRNSSSGTSHKSSHKRRNLKSRFTDTIRNISRSINRLTSDNEDDETRGRPDERPPQINTLV